MVILTLFSALNLSDLLLGHVKFGIMPFNRSRNPAG